MKYFAEVYENKVINVVVSEENTLEGFIEYSNDGSFKANPAVIGGVYDSENNVFILPKPYDSWVLNNTTYKWESPEGEAPSDGVYHWDENTTSWVKLS